MQIPDIGASSKRFYIEIISQNGTVVGQYNEAMHVQLIPEAGALAFKDNKRNPHTYFGFLYHIMELQSELGSVETSKLIVEG